MRLKVGTYGGIKVSDYYREKLKQGQAFEDFVYVELYKQGVCVLPYVSKEMQYVGENHFGIEVKNDCEFRSTGNLYIEYAEKTKAENSNYISSGIFRNDNSWLFAIGDYQTIYFFDKKRLKNILVKSNTIKKVETPTSRGYLLPVDIVMTHELTTRIINVGHEKYDSELSDRTIDEGKTSNWSSPLNKE